MILINKDTNVTQTSKQENIQKPLCIDALAAKAQMSPRTFTRKFKQLTGLAPNYWIQEQRIYQAKILLETTACTIESTAYMTGYTSPLAMRKHFKKAMNITPSAYRNKHKNNTQAVFA